MYSIVSEQISQRDMALHTRKATTGVLREEPREFENKSKQCVAPEGSSDISNSARSLYSFACSHAVMHSGHQLRVVRTSV